MDDIVALVERVRDLELTANRHILSLDMAAIEAETSPDLIHFTVDGRLRDRDDFLRMVAANPDRQSIEVGPLEAIVIAPNAVLLSYPLSEKSLCGNDISIAHEHASVLWMRRDDKWQSVFIHATSRLAPVEAMFNATAASGNIVTTLVVNQVQVQAVDEATVAARKTAAIAHEKGAVEHFRKHDIEAATASTHEACILIETDGSRQGRAHWLALVGDERRTLGEPAYGPFEVIAITPQAMLVIYTMDTYGSYDGAAFTNAEALSSLWVEVDGKWQAVFMQATPVQR